MDWFRIITGFYIPVYIFLAMLNVYGNSTGKTFFRAFVLLIGYITCIIIVGIFSLLVTALSI